MTFKVFSSQSLCLLSCFIELVGTSRIMLKRSGESSYYCYVSYFWEETFNNSPLKMMLPVHFSRIFFYQIEEDPFFSNLLSFYHKQALKLIKCFFCFCRDDHGFFFFKCGKQYQFKNNYCLLSWNKLNLVVIYYSFIHC